MFRYCSDSAAQLYPAGLLAGTQLPQRGSRKSNAIRNPGAIRAVKIQLVDVANQRRDTGSQDNRFMAKTVVSAFAFAVVVILSASAFAPRSVAHAGKGCDPTYGIEPCLMQAAR